MASVSHPLLPTISPAKRIAVILAGGVCLCGILLFAGWLLRFDPLIQFRPYLDPVKANTALALALLGLSLLACLRRRDTSTWLALLPTSIGFATLLQYIFSIDLGIDELLIRDHLAGPSASYPGRMPTTMALNLFIAGLALTPVLRRHPVWRALSLGLVGSLCVSIGVAGMLGYLLNLPGGFGWIAGGNLSPYSGAITLLVGAAMLAAAWIVHERNSDTPPAWMPLPVIVASCALALILYTGLRERERFYAAITTKNTLDAVGSAIHLEIERQSATLERIARRWSLLEGPGSVVREADAITFLGDSTGARSLAWLSPEGRARWVYPETANSDPASVEHSRDPRRNDAMLRARSSGLPAVSATIDHPGLGPGFSIYAPILTFGGYSGYAATDFVYEAFFENLHRRLERTVADYDYTVEIGGVRVFDSRDRLARVNPLSSDALDSVFPIYDRRIRVTIEPDKNADTLHRLRLPEVALATGLGIALLIGLSVHFARAARAGQRETERANQNLRAEIEERRQAEAALQASQLAERKLGLVAARTDNIVLITRPDGAIDWVNDAFTRLFERPLFEVCGHPVADILTVADPTAAVSLRQAISNGESLSTDLFCLTPHGRHYDLSLDLQPIYAGDGRLENYIILASDITQRVETERELRRAKIEADAASRAKSDFLASMSHEIRTPMNGVIGMTSLLLHTPLSVDQRDSVNTIRQSGETLLTIINDILDFSKIESGHLELEIIPFELSPLIEETLELFSPLAASRGLDLAYRIDPSLPAWIEADPTRLRQILANLVNNAVKFTPSGSVSLEITPATLGESSVSATRTSQSLPGRAIEFFVRDTGIGIAPDRRDRLFKPFSQIDSSTTRKYGGTGLGLVICQRLTQLMGGQISVSSEIGEGSLFRFTLPLRPAASPSESRPPLPPVDRRPVTLVLESHPLNRRRLAEQIALNIGPVIVPANPVELAAMLATPKDSAFAPDLIVVDTEFLLADSDRALSARLRPLDLPILWLHPPGHSPAVEDELGSRYERLARPARTSQIISALRRHLGLETTRPAPNATAQIEHLAETIPLSILLVEDNLVNQKVALRFLERLGYRADAVANGLEAVRSLTARPYDLLLMDLQMPEMDGFEAAREIRQTLAAERQPRIVALTANALQGDREACLAAGMDDYITKPVKIQDIAASIHRLFAKPGRNG